jgi:hypothetical protein
METKAPPPSDLTRDETLGVHDGFDRSIEGFALPSG